MDERFVKQRHPKNEKRRRPTQRIAQTFNIYNDCIINCLQDGADDTAQLYKIKCVPNPWASQQCTIYFRVLVDRTRSRPTKRNRKRNEEEENIVSAMITVRYRYMRMRRPSGSGRRYRPTDEIYWSVHLSDETHISLTKLFCSFERGLNSTVICTTSFRYSIPTSRFRQIFEHRPYEGVW